MVGDGAATLVARAFAAGGCPPPPDALARFLAIYNARLLKFTRPYERVDEVLEALEPRMPLAVLTNKPLASTRYILDGLDLARFFQPDLVAGGDGPLPRKPDPSGLNALCDRVGVDPASTADGRRFRRRLADGAGGRNARLPGQLRVRVRERAGRVPPGRRRGDRLAGGATGNAVGFHYGWAGAPVGLCCTAASLHTKIAGSRVAFSLLTSTGFRSPSIIIRSERVPRSVHP